MLPILNVMYMLLFTYLTLVVKDIKNEQDNDKKKNYIKVFFFHIFVYCCFVMANMNTYRNKIENNINKEIQDTYSLFISKRKKKETNNICSC